MKIYDMKKVLEDILKEIRPSLEQEVKVKKLSEKFLEITNQEAERYNASAIIAGSLTRDTWLPVKNEFDVFIIFPENLPEDKLEKIGLKLGKKVIEKLNGEWRLQYAQHPYVRGTVKGVDVDIVPCYKVESGEKIKSAVDRTPFHVKYLNEKFPRKYSDDVRLLKQFLQANNIYGADSRTKGFSGYICEILAMKYGGFENVLKNMLDWKPREIIDIENYWKEEQYDLIRKKFKDDILIVIDPVDKRRNAAAAISAKNFYVFKKIAREFLQIEKRGLFFRTEIKPLLIEEFNSFIEERGAEIFFVKFKKPDIVDDILYPQLEKTAKRLESIMKEYEFSVLKNRYWTDDKENAGILLEFEVSKLPKVNKRIGPYVFDVKNCANFIHKYRKLAINGPYVEENNWCVDIKRPWKQAENKLKDTLKDNRKSLEAKGIPNYIAKEIAKKFEILDLKEIKKFMNRNKSFAIFLRKYFEKEKLV